MRAFFTLSLRNVFRNRRRTLLTVAMAGGGVCALMLAGGFFAHMFRSLREGTIQNGLGHLQVHTPDALSATQGRLLEHGLGDYQRLSAAIEATPHVRAVAPRIDFNGMISNGASSATFLGSAVDPVAEDRIGFRLNVIRGHGLRLAHSTIVNEALLGTGLAASLDAAPGDTLTLLALTADGALNGVDVDVVGIVSTGVKERDERLLRIALPAAQQLLQSDRVTKLVVGLDATEETDAVRATIVTGMGTTEQPIAVQSWWELATYYHQVRRLFGGIFAFLGAIVVFMVVMSSANTMVMAVLERTREIGTMLAMGTPRSWMLSLLLLEGALIGTISATTGALSGWILTGLLNRVAIDLPPPPGYTVGWVLQVAQVPVLTFGVMGLVVVTLTLASLPPAIRAARLDIVESLTYV